MITECEASPDKPKSVTDKLQAIRLASNSKLRILIIATQ